MDRRADGGECRDLCGKAACRQKCVWAGSETADERGVERHQGDVAKSMEDVV